MQNIGGQQDQNFVYYIKFAQVVILLLFSNYSLLTGSYYALLVGGNNALNYPLHFFLKHDTQIPSIKSSEVC